MTVLHDLLHSAIFHLGLLHDHLTCCRRWRG